MVSAQPSVTAASVTVAEPVTVAESAAVAVSPTEPADLRAAIASIPDPEVPVINIEDLGILREIRVDEVTRTVTVLITPTYSGCPAMDAIRLHIDHVARREGYTATVQTQLSPAWTTDWMSDAGRDKLREFGIAPPGRRPGQRAHARSGQEADVASQPVGVSVAVRRVTCPLCGSTDTQEISRFGSTACKALRRCNECREPFDEFKTI